MTKYNKNVVVITNFLIAFMLMTLVSIAFTFNTRYAFNDTSEKPYYKGNENNQNVSIMFNVYWGTEYIDGILDILDRYDVKTTFFVGGSWIEKNSEMLKKIHFRGHEIGNHGYFHKDQDKLDFNGNYNEIMPTNLLIERYIGYKPILFAPPSGAYNKATLQVANNLSMKTIMWSKDTIDWRDKDAGLVYKRATNNISNGDLILAHPTRHTLEALPKILDYYKEKGFNVVKVSECIQN